jgi:hypothetical protein
MPLPFDEAAIAGVLGHMNADHVSDNLLIVRAFGPDGAVAARMTGFDGDEGRWDAELPSGETVQVSVPWPSGSISERPEVRREIVALYDEACRRLGVQPRPHS